MPKVTRGPKFRRGGGAAVAGASASPAELQQRTSRGAAAADTTLLRPSARTGPPSNVLDHPQGGNGGNRTLHGDNVANVQISSAAESAHPPAASSSSNSSSLAGSSSLAKPLDDRSQEGVGKKNKGTSTTRDVHSTTGDGLSSLSRGQRKRQAKKEQYLRKEKLVMASLKLRHDDDQKRRIDGLDAIRTALLESVGGSKTKEEETALTGSGTADASSPKAPATTSLLKSNHAKQKLVQREAAQMSLVLQHPAFQHDPFDAIRQHLQNTASQRGAVTVNKATTATKKAGTAAKSSDDDDKDKEKHRVRRRKHRVKPTRSKSRR